MKNLLFLLFSLSVLTACSQNINKELPDPIKGVKVSVDTPVTCFTGEFEMISTNKDGAVKSHWKNDRYSIEKSIVGYWEINTFKPVTPALVTHLKKADGVETVYNEKRYQMTVYVAKMHEYRACELIAAALDSFKE